MFKEEGRVQAAISDARGSASVDRRGLGVQDAELLVKFLRYLTGKLDDVAAVEFSIGPVEPAQEGDLTTNPTLAELLRPSGTTALACASPLPVGACRDFNSVNQHKPLVHPPGDPHT